MPKFKCHYCDIEIEAKARPFSCAQCKNWNTLDTLLDDVSKEGIPFESEPVNLEDVAVIEHERLKTGIEPVDDVTGGGFVKGGIYLISGEPGIGKSTIMAQICGAFKIKVLYCSAEESLEQVKMRTDRIGVHGKHITMWNESRVEKIIEYLLKKKIKFVVVDSIQVMRTDTCNSAIGSVTQVREAGNKLVAFAKTKGVTVILVGHVTKDGSIAGPKTLEHMVDAAMYFEQDEENKKVRSLECPTKNRFAEIGVRGLFQMGPTGLIPWKTVKQMEVRAELLAVK